MTRDLPARIAFCVIVLLLVGVGTYWEEIVGWLGW